VWFAKLTDGHPQDAERLTQLPEWTERIRNTEVLLLAPTDRSLLR